MPPTDAQLLVSPVSTKKAHPAVRRALSIVSATLVIAVAAHVSFPLPFTPVPFTLQPLAVLAVALWLGPRDGAIALVLYLLEGAAYLPVFAPTGPGGIAQICGPTGGYLLSYPLVALIAGGLTQWARQRIGAFSAACLACTLATAVLFAAGASWLAWQLHFSLPQVWMAAVLPFIPGEIVKIFAAAGGYRALTADSFTK